MVAKGRNKFVPGVGEKNPFARLSLEDVKQIRLLLAEGKLKQKEIAAIFGVKQPTISAIKHRRHWNF